MLSTARPSRDAQELTLTQFWPIWVLNLTKFGVNFCIFSIYIYIYIYNTVHRAQYTFQRQKSTTREREREKRRA